MKQVVGFCVMLLSCISPAVMADCSDPRLTTAQLNTLIAGNTVCATLGTDQWQEQHRSGGALWDFKKGPSDPIDPTAPVGSWSIAGNHVTYTYGSNSYMYTVHGSGNLMDLHSFCGIGGAPAEISGAYLKPGITGCP